MAAVLVLLMAVLVSGDVSCPDGGNCTDGETCCEQESGYSCCAYPNFAAMRPLKPRPAAGGDAVSRTRPYLCPNGRVCNFGSHCCFSDQGWSCCFTHEPVEEPEKLHSVSLSGGSQNISEYCPDGSTCPPHKKCCMTESGWHCCKIPDPHPSIPADPLKPAVSVVACNAHKSCLSGQTCCRGFLHKWSCCPFPKGECCRDGSSCCNLGAGWSCGPKGTCVWAGLIIPRKRTLPEQ